MVLRGGTLSPASLFTVINLCGDLLYAVFNPRVEVQ